MKNPKSAKKVFLLRKEPSGRLLKELVRQGYTSSPTNPITFFKKVKEPLSLGALFYVKSREKGEDR